MDPFVFVVMANKISSLYVYNSMKANLKELLVDKTCKVCGETKDIEEFPSRNGGKYKRPECKVCYAKRFVEYNKNKPKALSSQIPRTEVIVTHKLCSKCHELKTIEHFRYRKTDKNYQGHCITCEHAYQNNSSNTKIRREWRINNPERTKSYSHKYYINNKTKVLARTGKYQKQDLERTRRYANTYRYRNIDLCRFRSRVSAHRWRLHNYLKMRAGVITRRIRESTHSIEYTRGDIDSILQHQQGRCIYCNEYFSDDLKYTLDHIIPLSREGTSNSAANIQLLCKSCNCSKNNKTHEEYLLYLEVVFPDRYLRIAGTIN